MNLYFTNMLLMQIIREGLKYLNKENHPMYIHFIKSKTNNVPDFLSDKNQVCIVLQRQYKDLKLDYRYVSVTLTIDGEERRFNIDLSSILTIDVFKFSKFNFNYRLENNYIKDIENMSDDKYMQEIKEKIDSYQTFLKNLTVDLIPKSINNSLNKNKINNIINIDDIIKKK